MKLRVVPPAVFDIMSLNEKFKYKWIGDNAFSLIGLGTSYLLEFFEFYGDTISKYYDRFVKDTSYEDKRFHMFISQERRHAAAHKKLNLFVAKNSLPPTREKYHPRVYDFMYTTYKSFVEPIVHGIEKDEANGLTIDSPSFKEALKSIAIFETEVCLAAFSFFDNVMDKGKLDFMMDITENPGILYLLGYHYAEEIEHCHVSIETYEKIYGEKLWTEESIAEYIKKSADFNNNIINATFFVSRELGVDISLQQILSRLPERVGSIKPGFDAKSSHAGNKIEYLVDKWDSEWEPALLRNIKNKLAPEHAN